MQDLDQRLRDVEQSVVRLQTQVDDTLKPLVDDVREIKEAVVHEASRLSKLQAVREAEQIAARQARQANHRLIQILLGLATTGVTLVISIAVKLFLFPTP